MNNFPIKTQQVRIKIDDGHTLDARLDMPEGHTPKAFAIFAHCFTCSKSFRTTVQLSRALAENGFGVLRVDFTGLGGSEGDFSDTNFSTNVRDLLAGIQWLRENHQPPTLIYGHSFGGTAAIVAASLTPEAKAVATINSPFEPAHVAHTFSCDIDSILEDGEKDVQLAGRTFTIKKQFIEDIRNHDMAHIISHMKKHFLIFHTPEDDTVDIDNARKIYEAAKHPKTFVSLPNADHFLRDDRDADYVGDILAIWANRYAN